MTKLESLRPMLNVADLAATIAFYTERLGFSCRATWGDDAEHPTWCHLERDNVSLMFAEFHRHGPGDDDHEHTAELSGCIYLYPDDVDALHTELMGRGLVVEWGPETMPHGMREFGVHDPDGYTLVFGTPDD